MSNAFEDDVKQIAKDLARRGLDEHGQPQNRAFNARHRVERDTAELLGIAKGLLADGIVVEQEAEYLRQWGTTHPEAISRFPVSLLFTRLNQFFRDGQVDDDERAELRDLLSKLVGGQISVTLGLDAPSELPLDSPPPLVCWDDEVYVFTGRFAWGTRAHCHTEVISRGGRVENNVTRRTTFLVLGTFSSPDWKNTSYGRKIERAAELRDSGFALRIVGEDHWVNALSRVGV